jgi:hypothetical protein
MDKRVYLAYYDRCGTATDKTLRFSHPLSRRMTPMQLAVMEAFERLKIERPEFDAALWHDATPVPIYFATAFGELNASLTVFESIKRDMLPVSPTAFQHSVHNCAPGYLAMVKAVHHPSATFTNSYLSYDKALFAAFHKLRQGLQATIIVVNGRDLVTEESDLLGECELAVLTTDEAGPHSRELTHFYYGYDRLAGDRFRADVPPEWTIQALREGPAAMPCASLPISTVDGSVVRDVQSLDGERLISIWRSPSV